MPPCSCSTGRCFSLHTAPQIYNADALPNLPLWIVWAGSSVIRGSFFSLVDIAAQERADNLTTSDYWKVRLCRLLACICVYVRKIGSALVIVRRGMQSR